MLKCQFHCHTGEDITHALPFSAKELISHASKKGFEVVAITNHRKFFFNEDIKKHAEKHNILLIPGIELEIRRKHIICLNVDEDIERVKSFEDLKKYKKSHPDCFIMAAHPFFPGFISLKKLLLKHIDIFDGIELSYAHTKVINFNRKAAHTAKKFYKPLVATSDSHSIKNLSDGYIKLDAQKNIKSVIENLKKNRIKNISPPVSIWKILIDITKVEIQDIQKKFSHKIKCLL
ncbi:PHP domain-containing protein [Candidatus Peregrinibacteria bacterium]|nr:PHP domain-containing protein [Candidatus Peregrinibacteria bacterium]